MFQSNGNSSKKNKKKKKEKKKKKKKKEEEEEEKKKEKKNKNKNKKNKKKKQYTPIYFANHSTLYFISLRYIKHFLTRYFLNSTTLNYTHTASYTVQHLPCAPG